MSEAGRTWRAALWHEEEGGKRFEVYAVTKPASAAEPTPIFYARSYDCATRIAGTLNDREQSLATEKARADAAENTLQWLREQLAPRVIAKAEQAEAQLATARKALARADSALNYVVCSCDFVYEADTGRWTLAQIDPACPMHGEPPETVTTVAEQRPFYECLACRQPCETMRLRGHGRTPKGAPFFGKMLLSQCCGDGVYVVSSGPYPVDPPASTTAKEET